MPRDPWNRRRLRLSLHMLGGARVVVLANRQPFRHDRAANGDIVVSRSASGLVTALEPLVEACAGVWVAHGAGTADPLVVDAGDGLDVPPANPLYRLRRVWLNPGELQGYYYGFANEGLWPLCHRTYVDPVFRSNDFAMYRKANARFAAAVCEEAAGEPAVMLVQDYHFALAPRFIRNRLPLSTIVAFWHIPWPDPARFRTCPWARQLLQGLLGSSIVGFQTPDDCQNFLASAGQVLGAAAVDQREGVVTCAGHRTVVRDYPVGAEWANQWVREAPPVPACRESVCRQLQLQPNVRLAVGVDRLDYTKGIVEKFLAVERLLDLYPELHERFVLVQIAEPSRDRLPAYRELRSRLLAAADRINGRFGTDRYRPLVLLESHHESPDVYRFLRAADVCFVGSLHDGMNLVAKEFVCARDDERGVLVLSRHAGAARQLTEALLVDPFDTEATAHALARALTMSAGEQAARMREMRATTAEFNTHWWAGRLLQDAADAQRASCPWPVLSRATRRASLQSSLISTISKS